MVQQLRVCLALAEDLGLVPGILISGLTTICSSTSRESDAIIAFSGTYTHAVHINSCKHVYIHIKYLRMTFLLNVLYIRLISYNYQK